MKMMLLLLNCRIDRNHRSLRKIGDCDRLIEDSQENAKCDQRQLVREAHRLCRRFGGGRGNDFFDVGTVCLSVNARGEMVWPSIVQANEAKMEGSRVCKPLCVCRGCRNGRAGGNSESEES